MKRGCEIGVSEGFVAGEFARREATRRRRRRRARGWPETVEDHQKMMEDESIEFTSKGDRDHVAYIFFKMSFDLREAVAREQQGSQP